MILGLLFVIGIGAAITPTLAENLQSTPLAQFRDGTPIEEIQCNLQKTLMKTSRGTPACIYEDSMQKMQQRGWMVIHTSDDNVEDLRLQAQGNTLTFEKTMILNGTSQGHGSTSITKWPNFTIEVPTQVQKGVPFNVTATWSWIQYETDENGNTIYDDDTNEAEIESAASDDLAQKRASKYDIADRVIVVNTVSGTKLLDTSFVLTNSRVSPLLGYGNQFNYYNYAAVYDESEIHQKQISLQIDDILDTKNSIYIWMPRGVSYDLYLFEDTQDTITIQSQQRPNYNPYVDEDGNPIDFVTKYYADMDANYASKGIARSTASEEVPTEEQLQRIKELSNGKTIEDIPETYQYMQNNNITDVLEYLGNNNFTLEFIEEFLKRYGGHLELQNYQPSFYFILPTVYATSGDITIYGNLYLHDENSSLAPAENVKACAYEYDNGLVETINF